MNGQRREKISDSFMRFLAAVAGVPILVLVAVTILVIIGGATVGIELVNAVALAHGVALDPHDALLVFTHICVALSVLLLLAPVCFYVRVGQAKRLDVIRGYYSPEIIARYFDQFWAGRDGIADLIDRWNRRVRLLPGNGNQKAYTDDESAKLLRERKALNHDLRNKFDELLKDDFGFGIYVVPLILLAAIAAIVMYFGFMGGISLAKGLGSGGDSNTVAIPLFGLKLDLVSIAAIFGAYTWVTSDSITRNYQARFHPSDLSWYALRLIVAIPLGEAISVLTIPATTDATKLSSIAPGTYGAFLAFVISMFSFDSIAKFLGNATNRFTGTQSATPAERDDLIVKLPGVDEETARRLGIEGITTIAQIVAADPIRLSVRSGLSFDFILGLIDAAILWAYVGGKITTLREFGFKGASSLLAFNDRTSNKDVAALAKAVAGTDVDRRDVDARRSAALAALQTAQRDAGLESDRMAKQQRLRAVREKLMDPQTPEGDKAALQAEDSTLSAALRPWDVDQPSLADRLKAAQCAYDDAKTDYEGKSRALSAAANDLATSLKTADGILDDLATKAEMKASGLSNIIQQLLRDQYAVFIAQLAGVASTR